MKNVGIRTTYRAALHTGAGLAAMALSSGVFAQDVAVEAEAQEAPPGATAETEAADDVIIVTGSRIGSVTPFNSPDPISIVSPEIARQEGKLDLVT